MNHQSEFMNVEEILTSLIASFILMTGLINKSFRAVFFKVLG